MNKEEKLVKYLIKNCIEKNGNIYMGGLNFGDFEGNVHASGWVVKHNLFQNYHKVGGDLHQHKHMVGGSLSQSNSTYRENIYQKNNRKLLLVNGKDIEDCNNIELIEHIRKLEEGVNNE